jgi:hypothetical protein
MNQPLKLCHSTCINLDHMLTAWLIMTGGAGLTGAGATGLGGAATPGSALGAAETLAATMAKIARMLVNCILIVWSGTVKSRREELNWC